MSWEPKYTISNEMLRVARAIGESVGEIKALNLSDKELAELENYARNLSTFASTSIEGNPLPLTDVKRLLKSGKASASDTEREVLNYNRALQLIYNEVKSGEFRLTIETIERVQKQVVEGLMDNPAHIGVLRQDEVIIRNPRKIDEIVFIPPDSKDVEKLITELLDFIDKSIGEIDPIILAGLFHRQFVNIHPFMDGNGRTTRLITTAILGKAGLDLFSIFSFENYYNRNITRYFKEVGLNGDYYELESNIDFSEWLEYFSYGLLDELSRVRKELQKPLLKGSVRLESHHNQILQYIRENGSITQREYGLISSRSLASRKLDFEKLQKLNLIQAKGVGRGTYYILRS